jgi:nucleotide sugar dehydrogenase
MSRASTADTSGVPLALRRGPLRRRFDRVYAARIPVPPGRALSIDRTPMNPPVSDLAHAAHQTLSDLRVMTVAVVGLGYVGLPSSLALADAGYDVIGVDIDPRRLEAISRGEVDLPERDRDRVATALRRGRFTLRADAAALEEADAVIIAVPTPVDERLEPDPRAVHAACAAVVEHAQRGQTVVLTSTTYVGTTRQRLADPLAARGLVAGEDVHVAFAPERINPGDDAWDQAQVPRVLGGMTPACARAAGDVLAPTAQHLHVVGSPEVAEMTKLFENTFRAVNLALVNEIAGVARHHGVDPVEVVDAAATKPYGFLAHYPAAGVGGHCIPVDPYYLLSPLLGSDVAAPLVTEAMRQVAARPARVAERALEVLERTGGSRGRVLVVGMAYKPGICDHRESPASQITQRLVAAGIDVDYHDPLVPSVEIAGAGGRRSVEVPDPDRYALAIVATMHPGRDYSWLDRVEHVLDGTYRTHAGRTRWTI